MLQFLWMEMLFEAIKQSWLQIAPILNVSAKILLFNPSQYLLSGNTRTMCEICSELAIKTRNNVINDAINVFLVCCLYTLFFCFYC